MTTLNFTTNIKAPAAKVWQVLWDDSTYRQWTRAFQEGSYAVSDWKEGSKIHFLSPNGDGMFGIIAENKSKEFMAFRHLGEVKKFEEQPETDETKSWRGARETYTLTKENGFTTLKTNLDSTEQFQEYFQTTFPKAMALVKELAEQPIMITVEAMVEAPVEKVWTIFTAPQHITKWYTASDDWHTPKAENNLTVGGKFLFRMEAKDGSFGFDFGGVYTQVKPNQLIACTLDDRRIVETIFTAAGNTTTVKETFEAETENSIALQRGGWQAILDNLKKYAEANPTV